MKSLLSGYPPSYVKPYAAWNDRFITDPVGVVLTELFAGWRWLTPSAITLIAFGISLFGVYFFLDGTRGGLILGAVFWQINYILDGVDGKLARKRTEFAPYGAMLDHHLDRVKKGLALLALLVVQKEYQWVMMALVATHYVLMRMPIRRNSGLVEGFKKLGAKASLDPLDQVFLLLFVAPLFNCVFEMLVLVVVLQLVDHLVHFSLNLFQIKKVNT